MNLASTVLRMATHTLVVTRRAPGVYLNGRYVSEPSASRVYLKMKGGHAHGSVITPQVLEPGFLFHQMGALGLVNSWALETQVSLVLAEYTFAWAQCTVYGPETAPIGTAFTWDSSEAAPVYITSCSNDALPILGGGVITTLSIPASVQPISGNEIQRLPEGIRDREVRALYTTQELQTANAPSGVQADRIVIDGEIYEVNTVERWNELGSYWKALATRSE